ncbi:acyl-CoA thioesterase [Roseateles sp. P5_E1]
MRLREDPRLAHEIEITPAFHDLDPMEIVWHGRYVQYLEQARCALLQRFNYDYPQMRASGYAWPIIHLQLKYVRPAEYGMRLGVRACITEWEHRLRIDYTVRDLATNERLTKAHTLMVAVDMRNKEMQFASPPILFERLGISLP